MPVRKQVELASYKMGVADPGADADDVLRELTLTDLNDVIAADLGYGEQRRLDLPELDHVRWPTRRAVVLLRPLVCSGACTRVG